jgi:hypothetical protein
MDGNNTFPPPKTSEADLSEFAPYLDGLALTEAQQQELLQTLWAIMCAFADYGFGIEPTQLICGWIEESRAQGAIRACDAVELEDCPTTQFNSATRRAGAEEDT